MRTFSETTAPHGTLNWSMGLAVLLILAGLLAILAPLVSGIAITLIVGWILVMVGAFHFLLAWKRHHASSILWESLIGVLYLIAGLYLILHPILGLTSLTLILAVYLLFKGTFEIIHYFQLRSRGSATWLLINGVINLVLALLIWRSWPFSSVWVIGSLIGISILFTGFSRLMLTMGARRMLPA